MRNLFLPCLLALAALMTGVSTAPAQTTPITLADDAYHYKYWPAGPLRGSYTEWWYFNVYDEQQNVQAIFVYFVTNPDQIGKHFGIAPMLSVAYTPGAVSTKVDLYPVTEFSAKYGRADVQLGGNSIEVKNADDYHLTGASKDGALTWDLMFERQAESFKGLDRAHLGAKPWEKVSWLAYMPRAAVTGTLSVNGTSYSITGSGYHDHDWGEWIAKDVPWNWAQYSQPGLWFDLYDFIGGPMGSVRVNLNGRDIEFTKSQYTIVHTKWGYDKVNHTKYPVKTKFTADNGTDHMEMTMDALQTDPLGLGLKYPAPEYLIYEQTAAYTGKISTKNAAGDLEPQIQFAGNGFKEYTVERK